MDAIVDGPLKDRSILVVEDDVILSTDIAFALTEAGCKAVVPTTSNAAALSAMVHYLVDAAVLDVNVQNEWVFPVATALQTAGIPFLFLTAYARESIPVEHRDRPFLQKPHQPQELIDTLLDIIGASASEATPPVAANDEVPAKRA
jgi:DNA-binding response OmpR family regulator